MNVNKYKVKDIIDALQKQKELIEDVLKYERENGVKEYGDRPLANDMREAREHCMRSASLLAGAAIGDLTAALTVWPDLPPVYATDVVNAVKAVLGPDNAEKAPENG